MSGPAKKSFPLRLDPALYAALERVAAAAQVRITQRLVKILQERTADGYVFRTDLRLRPDPSSTPPVVAAPRALAYYESVGQNWERAAFIKARPCAGDLPRAAAASIYRRLYWLRPGFDRVALRAPKIAAELFDTGVNMGTGTATGFLQRALNALNRNGRDYADIAVDRKMGTATVGALSAFFDKRGPSAETVLLKAIDALQGAHYVRLAEARPSQEVFLYGWLSNRIG